MLCPSCSAEIEEPAGSCPRCGASFPDQCPRCGSELSPEANYCSRCGRAVRMPAGRGEETRLALLEQAVQRLAPAAYAERLLDTRGRVGRERRTVTILFCDVQGSTALSEGLDPEDVMEIMDGAFDVLISPIYRYEGTLARLMGDAVLAFFGAPIAHEDDPERACRAALAIIDGVQAYAKRLEQERGIAGFNVRIGIHTGLVVVGEVGSDLRVEYTAMGDAVNLAKRLESAAEPGTILVSQDTQRLIEPLFHTAALGPVQVTGRVERVPIYSVLAPKAVEGKPRGIAGLDSPLVGRDAEFAALMAAVERVRGGEGGIVTVVGEAGIGKSRLVAEVRKASDVIARPEGPQQSPPSDSSRLPRLPTAAHKNDVSPPQWIEGRCLSYSGSVAYQLWADLLRNWLALPPDAEPLAVREALEQWVRALCPDRTEEFARYLSRMMALPLPEETEMALAEQGGQQIKEATFGAVEACIEGAARGQPLVLVCEDIYWSDATSMALLEQLLPLTEQVPLLLTCVFRPRQDHPSWHVREVAAQEYAHRHTEMWLQPLSEKQSAALARNLLRSKDLAPTLRARILHLAEGNPLYVEEIIRSLITQGAIVQEDAGGRWQVSRQWADASIPGTLNGVLTSRIDRLPEDTKRVLQLAAVIGRIFPYGVLASITPLDGPLDAHLRALQDEQMIRQRAREPEREYIFKHELTREAAYGGLLKRERAALHGQVAKALEDALAGRIEEQLGALAHHWEHAGDTGRAIGYLLRAGDRARVAYAHEEALHDYQRALTLAEDQADLQLAARTWMKLGLTHHGAFEFPQAREAYDRGFALWQQAARRQPATRPSPAPHPFRMDWPFTPLTFDPPRIRDLYSLLVMCSLFSRLVDFSPELDIVPDAALSWEVLEGGRRYVFHLRDDGRWSDGTPVTASDFEYAWKRMLDPAVGCIWAHYLHDIAGARAFHQGELPNPERIGVSAQDDATLVVQLEAPASYFLHIVPLLPPVPRHRVEADPETWAEPPNLVNNGPFTLQSLVPGRILVLARNPHYHGPFTGNAQRVVLSLILNPRRQLQMYEADELDVFAPELLDRTTMRLARQRHAGEDFSLPGNSIKLVGFDVTRPPFDDVRVRQAFALGTDRSALADVVSCAHFPASGGFVPPGMPGHAPGIALPFDTERAHELLREAGHPGGRGFPAVTLHYVQGGEALCEELQAQWRTNLGIDIAWETLGWPLLLDRMFNRPPQLLAIGMPGYYPHPDCFLRSGWFQQWSGWQHALYDQLVQDAPQVVDRDEGMAAYERAQRILVEEAPIVPLMYHLNMVLVKPWVTKYPYAALGRPYWQDIVMEPH